jgi:hypothetical protein
VWVSYDDGDHWQSLRLNMPAISVRDLELKDDSACLCSDLIAGTHGRGFWILDNVTPLRAAVEARHIKAPAYLVKPATAVRVRFAGNDPTPWPPEMPAGENPPQGAVIDYYLAGNAATLRLEIADQNGKVVRTYSSADTAGGPDPAMSPEEYTRVCQRSPDAANCSVPLYWAAPKTRLATSQGMHRFIWDMRFDPVEGSPLSSALPVPHRTYLLPATPWVPPGTYTVRLVADGRTYTQPLKVVLDPRVRIPSPVIAQISRLSREMYDGAVALRAAWTNARKMSDALPAGDPFKARIDSIAPPPAAPRPGFGQQPAGPANLETARAAMMSAAMSINAAEVEPTSRQFAAISRAREQYRDVMARWTRTQSRGGREN